jgi:N-acetylglucosamine-6-sulfatase
VDGKSFAPLLGEEKPGLEAWRTGILVEHVSPTYQALRTNRYTYVRWSGGESRELYDLQEDPYQLQSRYDTADPALIEQLKSQLDALDGCAEQGCRAAEQL